MRILLLHNPKAGREEHEGAEIVRELEKAGHDVCYRPADEMRDGLADPHFDVVVAPGGDGTVGKVARQLIHTGIPISVLPIGTANNLARTLGFNSSIDELATNLKHGSVQKIDVGLAIGPWGHTFFFEGAGAGLLADYFRSPASVPKFESISKHHEIREHLKGLSERLRDCQASEWSISVDTEDLSGRYLLWEAMNIRSVGPVLMLAPGARTGDGRFDFIAVDEAHRAELADYLHLRLNGQEPVFPFPARRFKKMELWWQNSPIHFDDEVWPEQNGMRPEPCEIEIRVQASALWIWK